MAQQLYEDAVLLHRMRTIRVIRRDRFVNYWLDQEHFKESSF
jgi:hypothetical protein